MSIFGKIAREFLFLLCVQRGLRRSEQMPGHFSVEIKFKLLFLPVLCETNSLNFFSPSGLAWTQY